MRSSRVGGWMVSMAIGGLIVGMAGCAPPDAEEPVVEEPAIEEVPEEVVVRSFAEIEDFSMMSDRELEEFRAALDFVSGSKIVDIVIQENDKPDLPAVCNRKVHIEWSTVVIDPTGESAESNVVWKIELDQGNEDLWQPGDRLFIERKPSTIDRCFTFEPFSVTNRLRPIPSGPPVECWRPGDGRVYWEYYVQLQNEACEDGVVYTEDPVVVIDPGFFLMKR